MIQITVVKQDVRAADVGAEFPDHIRPAVAVRVAQRPNPAMKPLGLNVAVRRDRQAAKIFLGPADPFAGDQIVGVDQRAETGRKRDAAVVGIGRGQSSPDGCQGNNQANKSYGYCSHF